MVIPEKLQTRALYMVPENSLMGKVRSQGCGRPLSHSRQSYERAPDKGSL